MRILKISLPEDLKVFQEAVFSLVRVIVGVYQLNQN